MRNSAIKLINEAALIAGLPEGRVYPLAAKDNITLVRPRIEYQILPATHKRTGRKLSIIRKNGVQTIKKELYEVNLEITANILAEDQTWLTDFERGFAVAFPSGVNDVFGNWIKVRFKKASYSEQPERRVKEEVIKVFTKVSTLFVLSLTGRLTEEQHQNLIQQVNINSPEWR